MTPTRHRTAAILAELGRAPGPLRRLLGGVARRRAALLRELAAAGDVEAVLPLLPLALAAQAPLREQALDAVDVLVRGAGPATLAALDARARTRATVRHDGWVSSPAVTPTAVEALEAHRTAAIGIAALHRDGRVREAAVRRLAGASDPLALAFLLLRAGDRVEPVRAAARHAVEVRLAAGPLGAFVPVLDLAFRLETVRDGEVRPLAEALRAALLSPRGEEALRSGCASPTRSVRRRCVALALEGRFFDVRPVLRAALRDPDPAVRGLAAGAVGSAFEGEALREVAGEMIRSTTPPVRRCGLALLASRWPADARAAAEALLVDQHPRVRADAAALLGPGSGTDAAALRRRALSATARRALVGAIGGLRDGGSPADAAALAPFLGDPRPRVRLAALCALAQLDLAGHRDAALKALSDPSPRVSRAARDLLRRGPPVDAEHLLRTAVGGRFAHERRAAVDLMRSHEHWTAGLLLLRVVAATEDDLAARTEAALAAWHGRFHTVYAAPTPEQVAQYHAVAFALPARSGVGRSLRSLLPAMETRMRAAAAVAVPAGTLAGHATAPDAMR